MPTPRPVPADYPTVEHLAIRGFKSIANLELDLPRFAVFVGANGAGKTNLVQAIGLLGDLVMTGSTTPLRDVGGTDAFRKGTAGPVTMTLAARLHVPDAWQQTSGLTFPNMRGKGDTDGRIDLGLTLLYDATAGVVQVEDEWLSIRSQGMKSAGMEWRAVPGGEPRLQFDDRWFQRVGAGGGSHIEWLRRQVAESQGVWKVARPRSRGEDAGLQVLEGNLMRFWGIADALSVRTVRLGASELRTPGGAAFVEGAWDAQTGRGLAAALDSLVHRDGHRTRALDNIVRNLHAIHPRIEDIRTVKESVTRTVLQFKERGIDEWLDQGSMSDGVLHALALLLAIEMGGPGILAIEEPENALHPWAARMLVDIAKASPSQVLMTTHSQAVVDALADPESLFLVDQGDEGTHVEQALHREEALATILRESGQRLGEVWIDGSLGAVPGSEP